MTNYIKFIEIQKNIWCKREKIIYIFKLMASCSKSRPTVTGLRLIGQNTQPHPGHLMRSQGMMSRIENKRKQKETGSRSPTQLPWAIQSPPMICRDHTMSLFTQILQFYLLQFLGKGWQDI